MTIKRTFWLAVIVGTVIEATCCGLFAMFGRFGPCGPGNDITGFLFMLHLPGIAVAEALPESSWVQLPVIILVAAALWSIVAFVTIAVVRSLYDRVSKPVA
jgi:hypothetical protein